MPCPASLNCLQCDMTNPQECSICANGYFINSNLTCSKCSSKCIQCSSADLCSACKIGFTLPANQSLGQCLTCRFPCLTCIGVDDYCTSCTTGFTRNGWKCVNNTKIKFAMTLTDNPEQTLGKIQDLTKQILKAAGEKEEDSDRVTYENIVKGSTVVAGTLNPGSSSIAGATANLNTALVSGSLGSFKVTTYSITSDESDSMS